MYWYCQIRTEFFGRVLISARLKITLVFGLLSKLPLNKVNKGGDALPYIGGCAVLPIYLAC